MGFADRLAALLAPLGIYRTDGGVSGAELAALGAGLDAAAASLALTERELLVSTAESFGLSDYEALLPVRPSYRDAAGRRAALAALLRIDGRSFTLAELNATLCGCGVPAQVSETATAQTVSVCFPGIRGIPADIDALKSAVEQILPCHLAVEYEYLYVTWNYLSGRYPTWAAMEDAAASWSAIEALT